MTPVARASRQRGAIVRRSIAAWLGILSLIRATLVGAALGLAGCGSLPRNAVPVELMGQATVADMPEVRAAGGMAQRRR